MLKEDDSKVAFQHLHIVGGEENYQLGLDALFTAWVALGGHIAKAVPIEKDNEDQARKVRFIMQTLFKLRVDAAFAGLEEGLSPEEAVAQAEELVPSAMQDVPSTTSSEIYESETDRS
jgi:hypothetical protein